MIDAIKAAVHRAIAPWYMSIAKAMGSQEHYNEFLTAIAQAIHNEIAPMTADTDPALDGYRDTIALLRGE